MHCELPGPAHAKPWATRSADPAKEDPPKATGARKHQLAKGWVGTGMATCNALVAALLPELRSQMLCTALLSIALGRFVCGRALPEVSLM